MNGKIDVVDVLDREIQEGIDCNWFINESLWADRLRRTRDAIRDLLEADREYDEARAAADADDWGSRKVYERLEAAQQRRAAALAALSGGE